MKRTLHIALMLAAVALLAGCEEQIVPETTPEETIVVTPEGVQIPFEVTASTSADDDTKITVDYGGTHLFQAGDILHITGEHISGDLTMQGDAGYDYATFKGMLTWTGEGMPAADLPLTATLISEFNRMPDEGDPYANAIADYLDQAVQQFSSISGTGTYGGKTFALRQSSAFIQFEINMNGLSEDGKVKVRIQNKSVTEILASCDTVTIKGGKARFTAAFANGTALEHASVYIDGLIVQFAGSGATLVGNKSYKVTKTVNLRETPITWQARYQSGTIQFNYYKSSSLRYSVNGGALHSASGETGVTLQPGEIVQFYDDYIYEHGNIWSNDAGSNLNGYWVYGNVMSLVSSTEYAKLDELTEEKVFYYLFGGQTYLSGFAVRNHSTRDILLPATTLSPHCYERMFMWGDGLSRTPQLPATNLAESCYQYMFAQCSGNLYYNTITVLPATTLAKNCYNGMFYGCGWIHTAPPELPATTLAEGCYSGMFYGCSNLPSAPSELPATTLAKSCYSSMFYGCRSITVAPELPATTLADYCYSSMFYGCTRITVAPDLPAETLTEKCYNSMFYGCSELKTAPELPAKTLADNCYNSMFTNCKSLINPPALPAAILTLNCYKNMFQGCTGLTSAPALPAETMIESCYENLFSGCTSLATPPVISAKTLAKKCFYSMFSGCTSLEDTPDLPSTSLAVNCYERMFYGCTALKTLHVLPATNLRNCCYKDMFFGCTSLVTAPSNMLPSTSLTSECYSNMFYGCTGLTSAPDLPATSWPEWCYSGMFTDCSSLLAAPAMPTTKISWVGTLACQAMFCGCSSMVTGPSVIHTNSMGYWCFVNMFANCSSLTVAPELPSTSLSSECYDRMFAGCTSLTAAPALPATALATRCYISMFSGCTGLTMAPDLPATTLATYCYQEMFSGCTNLSAVKCLATNISATDCLKDWLSGVAAGGTFTKAASMDSWPTGASGIPDGWTVQDAL